MEFSISRDHKKLGMYHLKVKGYTISMFKAVGRYTITNPKLTELNENVFRNISLTITDIKEVEVRMRPLPVITINGVIVSDENDSENFAHLYRDKYSGYFINNIMDDNNVSKKK